MIRKQLVLAIVALQHKTTSLEQEAFDKPLYTKRIQVSNTALLNRTNKSIKKTR